MTTHTHTKEITMKMDEEFKKLDSMLNKEWDKWTKSGNGAYWFEIEHELMTSHGYSYTDECEWVKKVNAKIYNFGQY